MLWRCWLLQNERTDIQSTAFGKEGNGDAYRLFGMKSCIVGAMWHMDPLLGNDHEVSNYTTAAAG
jgi:hypothetical protein